MRDLINNHRSFDENVQSDKLKLLYHQSFPAVFFSLIVAFIYVGILWPKMNNNFLFIWLGVVVLSSFLRLFLFFTYRHKSPQGEEVLKWERPYFITLMMSSSIWGIGALLLSYNLSFFYQTITYFILMGMAGSALTVYSAIRYFSVSTVAIILLPITFWFLFLGNNSSMMMSALGIIFIVLTVEI